MSHYVGSLRELGGSHHVSGFVAKLTSEVGRFCHRDAGSDGGLEIRVVGQFADQIKSFNLRALAVRSVEVATDLTDQRTFDYRLHTSPALEPSGHKKRCRTDAALLYQSSHCRAREPLHAERIDLLCIARAVQQQALGREVTDVVEQHAMVALAIDFTVVEQRRDGAASEMVQRGQRGFRVARGFAFEDWHYQNVLAKFSRPLPARDDFHLINTSIHRGGSRDSGRPPLSPH